MRKREQTSKGKKPLRRRRWFWFLVVLVVIAAVAGACRPSDRGTTQATPSFSPSSTSDPALQTTQEEQPSAPSSSVASQEESSQDQTSSETADNSEPSAETAAAATGIRPEFQQAMDSYEAFFDEYIDFMTTYQDTEDPTSMMADYLDYMTQYAETMEQMEALDSEELSVEEAAYYAEVSARITQKLLEAGV